MCFVPNSRKNLLRTGAVLRTLSSIRPLSYIIAGAVKWTWAMLPRTWMPIDLFTLTWLFCRKNILDLPLLSCWFCPFHFKINLRLIKQKHQSVDKSLIFQMFQFFGIFLIKCRHFVQLLYVRMFVESRMLLLTGEIFASFVRLWYY